MRTGRFPIDGNRFTIDGTTYLLCHRTDPAKGTLSSWLLTLPVRDYVSALFPRSGNRYSIDFKDATGAERVFEVDLSEAGFIRLTDRGLSKRSLRPAPWQRAPRQPGRR